MHAKHPRAPPGPITGVAAGNKPVVKLTTKFTDGDAYDTMVVMHAMESPIMAAIKGPSDISEAKAIVISAAESVDPHGALQTGFDRV